MLPRVSISILLIKSTNDLLLNSVCKYIKKYQLYTLINYGIQLLILIVYDRVRPLLE